MTKLLWRRRQKKRVEHLLRDDLICSAEANADISGAEALIDVKSPKPPPWKQEFARKEVHRDLFSFPAAVVPNSIDADIRRFRSPCRINIATENLVDRSFENRMAEFVSSHECIAKRVARDSMVDVAFARIPNPLAAAQSGVIRRNRNDPYLLINRESRHNGFRIPSVNATRDQLLIDRRGLAPSGFDTPHRSYSSKVARFSPSVSPEFSK